MQISFWVDSKSLKQMFPRVYSTGRHMGMEGFKVPPSGLADSCSPVDEALKNGAWQAGYLSAEQKSRH